MRATNKLGDGNDIGAARSPAVFRALALRAVGGLGQRVLDGLLPPRCVACGKEIDGGQGLCADCWGGLTFIDAPLCVVCGLPFDFEAPETSVCVPCMTKPPPFDRARAALVYDDGSRSLILGFKHGDRTDRATVLARLMGRLLADIDGDDCLILPVPLHRWRLWRRRYNQSALLAAEMARYSRFSYRSDLLIRTRATPPQTGQNAGDRRRNVRGAFGVSRKTVASLAGRHVLLIDDVMTTGATVGECARVLKRAGAGKISVIAIARAVMPSRID